VQAGGAPAYTLAAELEAGERLCGKLTVSKRLRKGVLEALRELEGADVGSKISAQYGKKPCATVIVALTKKKAKSALQVKSVDHSHTHTPAPSASLGSLTFLSSVSRARKDGLVEEMLGGTPITVLVERLYKGEGIVTTYEEL
jgi:hypothetical protein